MNIQLYTRDNCVYCDRAKQLLKSKLIDFQQIHIGRDITRDTVVDLFPGVKTLPIVVIDEVNIGGFDQLVKYIGETAPQTDILILG